MSFSSQDVGLGSQEIPGETGKFGLGVQNKAGQRPTEQANRVLPRECTGHSKHSSNNTRDETTYGCHQMLNIEIRLIIFFAAENGEAVYRHQKKKKHTHTHTHTQNTWN